MTDENALRQVQDELEIRNLIARLAHLADSGDLEEYVNQFTQDAVWGGGRHPVRRGHDAIREGVRARRKLGHMGPGTETIHVVTTICLEIHDDQAQGRSVYHYYTGAASAEPTLRSLGVYVDTFRRTSEGWRLAERILEGATPTARD